MVAFVSFQNGQASVADLSRKLRGELTQRVWQELKFYFESPHKVNQLNAAAYRRGDIDVLNATAGEALLHEQLKLFPTIGFAFCGTPENGEFFGVLRDFENPLPSFQLSFSNPSTNFLRQYYRLNTDSDRQAFLYQNDDESFDSRQRLWFQAAIDTGGPAWTDVYVGFTSELPNITASTPVYSQEGQLIAVCATDVTLPKEFRAFLQNLELGNGGKAFVIDRRGQLIADSSDGSLMIEVDGKPQLRLSTASTDPLIATTAQELVARFGADWTDGEPNDEIDEIDLTQIQTVKQLTLVWNHEVYLVEVLPFKDDAGLDWLIVVVGPESSFVEQILTTINSRTHQAILLCSLAVVASATVGFWIARSITDPIVQINQASKQIAAGNWDKKVPIQRHDEIGELAISFNQMAEHLKQSFATLEAQKNAFARFFPPEYLDFLGKDDVTELVLGEHVSQEMGVMFSDIRNFTALAESMTPQASFDFINTYLRHMSPAIPQHQGFVVKFLGDGLMAVFPGQADDAVDAGIAKCLKLRALNHLQVFKVEQAIAIGVGIHVGRITVGTIGDHNRLQADVLSDCVNLCARLEGLTKVYQVSVLLSKQTVERLQHRDQYELRRLDRVRVKGSQKAIEIYEALDAEEPQLRQRKIETRSLFDQAVDSYRQGEFAQAQQAFHQVLVDNPHDPTVHLYLDRIETLIQQPRPHDWTGVWAFTEK
ncbi:MAG: adenylate/guanylate cyclase domain-containing protein [Leptolyngbyaceae cyanobacterium]